MSIQQNPIASSISLCIIGLVFLYTIKVFNISYPVSIVTKQAPADLSVVGEGKVTVVPDTATVQVGIIVSDKKTVEETQKQINQTNNKIIDAMKGLGIPKIDIKTSNYAINPNYSYENNTNRINGYSGNATLSIKVRKINLLPQVIEQSTLNGANQIYGTQYTIDKPENYREKARDLAIANAREQAQKLANSLGIKLGKVTNISESNPNSPYPVPMVRELNAPSNTKSSTPDLEQGSQEITSVVTLSFEKK